MSSTYTAPVGPFDQKVCTGSTVMLASMSFACIAARCLS
jgi:hypothetical protein